MHLDKEIHNPWITASLLMVWEADLIYTKEDFEPSLGRVVMMWKDPIHMMMMGNEL